MKELKVSAIREGTVIDHIPADATFKVVEILKLQEYGNVVTVAANLPSKKLDKNGIVKIGGKELTKKEVDMISVVAPQATVNIIKNYEVKQKLKISMPEYFDNILKCSNPGCVTNNYDLKTSFKVVQKHPLKVRCHHCEKILESNEIEII